ncbi:MAG: acetylornithine deacetylase/succinyl-diaminopimelate desuccinylase family protein [Acidiferrobacterales bacterium]|nr:acetylornithine deacetylase/succinyl-diaminopimelate desuccinylase family protein [Acidiferrobacterales bacterium]
MTPDTPLFNLSHSIRSRKADLIELTTDLIAIPTINPPGDGYLEICEFLEKRLTHRHFDIRKIRAKGALGDSDKYPRWNIIARHEGSNAGECVHFNSHSDVVAVGDGWTVDPFKAVISDDKIYGRGACDMKGGLAASIIAVEAFIDCFPNYTGAIEISATADEESGGFGGVAWLAEQGWFDPDRVQHVIIPEPLNKDRICLGHRGVWWAEVETFGRIAHGSMPFLGDCAVRHMGAVIQALEERLFPALTQRTTTHPIVPEGARQSTLNINSLHGGLDEPEDHYTGLPAALVPDRCRMILDRRFLLEESLEDVQSELKEILEQVKSERPAFDYDLRELFSVLPTMTEKSAPVVTAVSEAIKHELQVEPQYVISPGTYDQKHIDRIGKLHNCIAYGPGILDLAHQPDEYIGIRDMLDSAQVMARSLVNIFAPHGKINIQ